MYGKMERLDDEIYVSINGRSRLARSQSCGRDDKEMPAVGLLPMGDGSRNLWEDADKQLAHCVSWDRLYRKLILTGGIRSLCVGRCKGAGEPQGEQSLSGFYGRQ